MGRDYKIDLKAQSLEEMGNWRSVDEKNSLVQEIIKGRIELFKRLILVKSCGGIGLQNKTAIANM